MKTIYRADLEAYFGDDTREDLLSYIENLLNGFISVEDCKEEVLEYLS